MLALIGSPGLADKSWVTDQYDRYVRGDTVLAMPEDGGLLRVDEETGLGIALATDGNGRYCRLDPYLGTQLVLSEAYRNVAVTGARPLAVTNCLNFGSPEDPAVMWQFAEAVRGLGDGCAALGVPVTGGNVSFYNQTGTSAVHPTPVVGVLGVHQDVRLRVGIGFGFGGGERAGEVARASIVLLGETEAELGGSAWAHVLHGHLGGRPPAPRLAAERRLAGLLAAAAAAGCWRPRTTCPTAAWPSRSPNPACAAGSAVRSGCPVTRSRGCSASRPPGPSSRSGRVPRRPLPPLLAEHEVPGQAIGVVGGDHLVVTGCFSIPLAELAAAHRATLPALFG